MGKKCEATGVGTWLHDLLMSFYRLSSNCLTVWLKDSKSVTLWGFQTQLPDARPSPLVISGDKNREFSGLKSMISRPASAGLAASCQATHICHRDHCDFFVWEEWISENTRGNQSQGRKFRRNPHFWAFGCFFSLEFHLWWHGCNKNSNHFWIFGWVFTNFVGQKFPHLFGPPDVVAWEAGSRCSKRSTRAKAWIFGDAFQVSNDL